jgi:hypothetical protein
VMGTSLICVSRGHMKISFCKTYVCHVVLLHVTALAWIVQFISYSLQLRVSCSLPIISRPLFVSAKVSQTVTQGIGLQFMSLALADQGALSPASVTVSRQDQSYQGRRYCAAIGIAAPQGTPYRFTNFNVLCHPRQCSTALPRHVSGGLQEYTNTS